MSLAVMDTGAAIRKALVDDARTNDTFFNPATSDVQVWGDFPASPSLKFPIAIFSQAEVEPGAEADGRASLYSREKWVLDIYQREDSEGLVSIIIGAFDPATSSRTGGVMDAVGPLIGGTFVYVGRAPKPSPDSDVFVTSLVFRAARMLG